MRELKFRAWDEKVKAFVYSEYNTETQVFESYVEDDVFSIDGDREHINQYTGLKDKNGVEIYEGDVVEYDHEKYVVDFRNGSAILSRANNRKKAAHGLYASNMHMGVTVIGNIYENKELLEGV